MTKKFLDFFRERFGHELAPWQEELLAKIRRESPLAMFTTPGQKTDPFFRAWMENQPKCESVVLIGMDGGKQDGQGVAMIVLDEVAEYSQEVPVKLNKSRTIDCSWARQTGKTAMQIEAMKSMMVPHAEPEKPKREKFYIKFLPKRRLN